MVLFIAVGLFLFTYQSTQFHMTGFLLVLSASFLSGLRWTLAQLVLQKKEIGMLLGKCLFWTPDDRNKGDIGDSFSFQLIFATNRITFLCVQDCETPSTWCITYNRGWYSHCFHYQPALKVRNSMILLILWDYLNFSSGFWKLLLQKFQSIEINVVHLRHRY